ncbi:MAG: hypothetical protein HC841_05465 [Verrucomicrobiae bacterium]|nr:hypothetical protein [Verrucomicrobiae bacterium]
MSEIKSMAEMEQEYIRSRAELRRSCRIEHDAILFQSADGLDYDIKLSRCDTYEKIVHWAVHLSAKKWITVPMLREFIRLACSHHGLRSEGSF